MNEMIKRLTEVLVTELDQERFQHTMGVMHTAGCLAMRYNEDLNTALIAGLLHDCAKCMTHEEKLRICYENQIEITDAEKKNPGLLHAKVGAYLAKEKYHIVDERILCAIESHTTGKPGMSLLDKIIYIADYMEPGRDGAPNLPQVRKLAFLHLDECLYVILKDSLDYLKTIGKPIDPMTELTFHYYNDERNKKLINQEELAYDYF